MFSPTMGWEMGLPVCFTRLRKTDYSLRITPSTATSRNERRSRLVIQDSELELIT